MECLGHVQDGKIVIDPPVVLPEGAKVRVVVDSPTPAPSNDKTTLFERLQHLDGAIADLPSDFAAEHDHYIHGTPKRDG
jgi:hypothetical protein